jgi:hypothetical protein
MITNCGASDRASLETRLTVAQNCLLFFAQSFQYQTKIALSSTMPLLQESRENQNPGLQRQTYNIIIYLEVLTDKNQQITEDFFRASADITKICKK